MNRKGRISLGAALLLALSLWAGGAWAEEGASGWFDTEQGKVRLVAGPAAAGEGRLSLGLDFHLAPHWKIYWRSPGDAGFPPRLDWSGSSNLGDPTLAWPAPERFSVSGLETIGYTDAVLLPIVARRDPAQPAHVNLALSYLTCREICIPYDTTLRLDLPAGAAGNPAFVPLIERYAARVPGAGVDWSLAAAAVVPGSKPVLALRVRTATPLAAPDAFVEGPDGIAFGAPRLAAGDEAGEALLRLPVAGEADRLVGESLTVTLVDGARALEARVRPALAAPAAATATLSLLLAVLPLALLGGLILNVMPCVLPVLSIKLLGVIEQGGRSQRAVRWGFLATAAGVLLSFLILALAMVALKAAGVAVGWGVQFQQPLFLVLMIALTTLFAANLWGLFEVPLPEWLGDLAPKGERASLLGNVATGAFATLLATPCSAPFLGTAVGFALATGPVEIIAIFLTLGIGLAAPYLLVAAVPRLAQALPRPGRWMVALRRMLGFALAATALWLVSVLATQIGLGAALAAAALMLAAAAILALGPRAPALRWAPALLLLAAFVVPATLSAPPSAAGNDGFWRPFDRAAIAQLVRDGDIVFVDVTADWCLTCKVNKQLVIETPAMRARLAAPGTVAMRADWTRPSAVIAAYLRSFGRYGIPFNAVYGPGAPEGLALSEILTSDQVERALARAAGPGKVIGAAR
jgi:suppressor for copper-sensitivity B